MKTKDFDRLKELIEKEGFQLKYRIEKDNIMVLVEKKDPWEGVGFVENLEYHLSGGKKYFKVNFIEGDEIHIDSCILFKRYCKPSTEEAYVEQLKKAAFERFGLIKVGDEFNAEWNIVKSNTIAKEYDPDKWTYDSTNDRLFLAKIGDGGAIIYQKGKWAERVKKKD
jgi:hypothetical protein